MDSRKKFGLYIHWPFCQAKCPYCDFNSHVQNTVNQTRWKNALVSEIERIAKTYNFPLLDSIFFGGGTPSLMSIETVAAVIETAKSRWNAANDIEITLEANPTSVEADRFKGYADAGVNRVSIGIQALNDIDLKRLGRLHTVAEARDAFDLAASVFPRVSFDLIYARQDQSLSAWHSELTEALSMSSGHLSLYQLTIEDGTAFGDRFSRGSLRGLPSEDLAVDMYDLTQELTEKAGLPAYEISNHARAGDESKHNLIYWTGGNWAGVGPGAHGRLTLDNSRFATEAERSPSKWLSSVEDSGSGEILFKGISEKDAKEEYLMMGLRIKDGILIDEISSLAIEDRMLEGLVNAELLECSVDRIWATDKGRPLLNAIIRELLI